jgi:hypothetical protein
MAISQPWAFFMALMLDGSPSTPPLVPAAQFEVEVP